MKLSESRIKKSTKQSVQNRKRSTADHIMMEIGSTTDDDDSDDDDSDEDDSDDDDSDEDDDSDDVHPQQFYVQPIVCASCGFWNPICFC